MTQPNYIECNSCNYPGFDPRKNLCRYCNNSKQIVNPEHILCNKCGGHMCHLAVDIYNQFPDGLYNATVTGSYHSYHLFDSTSYTFNLCEKCLRNLFIEFTIKPKVDDLIYSGEDSWNDDQKSYEYRLWFDNGGHHQAYLDKKCNAVKDCPNTAVYTSLSSKNFTENACCENHKNVHKYNNTELVQFIPDNLKSFL